MRRKNGISSSSSFWELHSTFKPGKPIKNVTMPMSYIGDNSNDPTTFLVKKSTLFN